MFEFLRRLLSRPDFVADMPATASAPYRIFTTAHDEEVDAGALLAADEGAQRDRAVGARAVLERYRASHAAERTSLQEAAALAAERILPEVASGALSVTVLIDHSGSLRGEPAFLAAQVAEAAHQIAFKLRLPCEVLGFTTVDWKGGAPRWDWIAAGRPADPGRLCPLRHIVYTAFDSPAGRFDDTAHAMFLEGILKENVDGEALLWAAGRARKAATRRHLIMVLSDGAPVDDSTLEANPPEILINHLRLVISGLGADPAIRLCAVGLNYRVGRLYDAAAQVSEVGDVEATVVPFLTEQIRLAASDLRSVPPAGRAP